MCVCVHVFVFVHGHQNMLLCLGGFVEFGICGGGLFCRLKLLIHAFLTLAGLDVCSYILRESVDGLGGEGFDITVVIWREAEMPLKPCDCACVCVVHHPVSSSPNRKK